MTHKKSPFYSLKPIGFLAICMLIFASHAADIAEAGITPTPTTIAEDTPVPTATDTPAPTATPIPPTATPIPPTDTPVPSDTGGGNNNPPPADTPVPTPVVDIPSELPELGDGPSLNQIMMVLVALIATAWFFFAGVKRIMSKASSSVKR